MPKTNRRRVLALSIAGLAGLATGVSSCGSRPQPPNPTPAPPGPTRTAIPTAGRRSVVQYGAKGHGADDTEAFRRGLADLASRGGGVLFVPEGRWECGSLTLPSGVYLAGQSPASRLICRATRGAWIATAMSSGGTGLGTLTLDGTGFAGATMVQISQKSARVLIQGCHFVSNLQTSHHTALQTGLGTRHLNIEACSFAGFRTAVLLNDDPAGVTISKSTFTQWADRAIWVRSNDDRAASSIEILGNTIWPPDPSGTVRQPIQINGADSRPVRNVRISSNHVRGTAVYHKDPVGRGSADLISLHRCQNFEVSENICLAGGDVGITVARQSSNGVVEKNQCLRNASAGISIGSAQTSYTSNVIVRDNLCMDNGRAGSTATTPPRARVGINVYHGSNIKLLDNHCGNTDPSKTQLYGVTIIGSTRVTMTGNVLDSNVRSAVYRAVR